MKYIKIPKNVSVDYIPDDRWLCNDCIYCTVCPYDFECNTKLRQKKYEEAIKDEEE